jgi:hypothetical protein
MVRANTSTVDQAAKEKMTFKDVAGCDEAKVGETSRSRGDHSGVAAGGGSGDTVSKQSLDALLGAEAMECMPNGYSSTKQMALPLK